MGAVQLPQLATVSSAATQVTQQGTGEEFLAMTSGSFPSDPSSRKAILVLHEHDVEKCAYEQGAAQTLLDEDVYVLQFPVRVQPEAPAALRKLVDAGLAHPGNLLVQSPYDADTYEEASLAAQRFALAKHMHFSALCMHLGAREVSVEQIVLRTSSGKTTFDVKAERLGGSGQLAVENEEIEKLRAQMHLHDEFAGGVPNVAAAELLLKRTGLGSDPNMLSLVEMRRDGSNRLMTRKLTLSLSSETKRNLNVAGRLKVPTFVKLSAEYEKVIREQCDFTLTVVVRF